MFVDKEDDVLGVAVGHCARIVVVVRGILRLLEVRKLNRRQAGSQRLKVKMALAVPIGGYSGGGSR